MSYLGPARAGDLSAGTLIFGPLQALVIKYFYLDGLCTGFLFAEFKSPSENLANV